MPGTVKKVELAKMSEILPVIEFLFELKSDVKLTVTGNSMYPFLRHTRDSVLLSDAKVLRISEGDIVLFKRDTGPCVLHRVCRYEDEDNIYFVGDAQTSIEGPIAKSELIALVTSVYRNGKEISCRSFWWRTLSFLWLLILPIRPFFIALYTKSMRILRSFISIFRKQRIK